MAFPCLYICNDIRDIDIAVYEAEISDDIRYYRYAGDALEWLGDLMQWGYSAGVVPVVCAYNLMFDLQPIMHDLARQYDIKVNAQSATHVYTLDLCFEGAFVFASGTPIIWRWADLPRWGAPAALPRH